MVSDWTDGIGSTGNGVHYNSQDGTEKQNAQNSTEAQQAERNQQIEAEESVPLLWQMVNQRTPGLTY